MRIFNFSAGPSTLPVEVLEEVRDEIVNYRGSGMSIVEMSHRSAEYDTVHRSALDLVRGVFGVPDEFEILLIQGGATLQFGMLPMNLLGEGLLGAYVDTGAWASKAISDASHHGEIYTAWSGSDHAYARVPSSSEIEIWEGTRYLHLTSNETIGGVQYREWPDVGVPLVADMSSDLLSRRIPWARFDVVYGGVQKNLAPAGVAIVIIRRSALEAAETNLAAYFRYGAHAERCSLYNTPPVFSIYVMEKVLRWITARGGVPAMEAAADEKAGMLYDAIDLSDGFYASPVGADSRSRMNVVFRIADPDLESRFVADAAERGLSGLKGHRSVGGIRASVYNAMPVEGVEALVAFMADFRTSSVLA